jgi:ubiquitin-conjugating enzyme E2 variant
MAIWLAVWVSFFRRFASGPSLGPLGILAAIGTGGIVADGLSGLFHWFFDTFLEETTPIVGVQLVAPFREHHRDPLAMTRHGFLELNGNNCVTFLPFMAVAWWLGPVEPHSFTGAFFYLFWLSLCLALGVTNQLHSWAHDPAPPLIGRWLQRLGLAISPAHHARHHTPPHRSHYCVTNGWLNHFADRLSLFVHAERAFTALGVPRKRCD